MIQTTYSPLDPFAQILVAEAAKASRAEISEAINWQEVPVLGDWTRYDWSGYEIHHRGSPNGGDTYKIGIAFGESTPTLAAAELEAGSAIRTGGEFRTVWLKCTTGTEPGVNVAFAIVRRPAVRLEPTPIIKTVPGAPLSITNPIAGYYVRQASAGGNFNVNVAATDLSAFPIATPANTPLNVSGERAQAVAFNESIAAAMGAILASTGALAAGDYEIDAWTSTDDNVLAAFIELVHRNATDNGDITLLAKHKMSNNYSALGGGNITLPRYTLAANERILFRTSGAAMTAGKYVWTRICYRRVA